ncbi:hypothetical protein HispidOSU_027241 [Sigmodon hispidus]
MLFQRLWVLGSAAAGRRSWRVLTNSDGANDGATDQRVTGERWQILASALTDWLLGSELRDSLRDRHPGAQTLCGRKPAFSAGDQQAAVCSKGVSGNQPQHPSPAEAPRRRRWEDCGEGQGQPLLKDCLNLILSKSEHLHHGRPSDAGAVETRPATAPCVPARDFRNPGRRLKTANGNGPLLLTQTRQSTRPMEGGMSARVPPPAYKSGAALQLRRSHRDPVWGPGIGCFFTSGEEPYCSVLLPYQVSCAPTLRSRVTRSCTPSSPRAAEDLLDCPRHLSLAPESPELTEHVLGAGW